MMLFGCFDAMAANCFKYPKKCAKSFDKARREATEVAIDIATLGHTKRERERQEAKEKEQRAEQERQHARKIKQERIEKLKAEIVALKDFRALLERVIADFGLIANTTESHIQLMQIFTEDAKVDKLKALQIRTLVLSQNQNLMALLETKVIQENELKEKVEFVKRKLSVYQEQVENFPVDTQSVEEQEFTMAEIFELSFEILSLAQQNEKDYKEQVLKMDEFIQAAEASLAELVK